MNGHTLVNYGALVGPWSALVGVLTAGLYAIMKGKLVPAATLEVLITQWESRLNESREREQAWKAAHDASLAVNDELSDQVAELTVLGETTVRLLRALPSGRDVE